MEITVIRQHGQEERVPYQIEPQIHTVDDLRRAIQNHLHLDCEFSLGFVHPDGVGLADLGLEEGSVVTVSDWSAPLLFSLDDLPQGAPAGNQDVGALGDAKYKWFEQSTLIDKLDYDKGETFKKILNSKIKVRVICGHDSVVATKVAATNDGEGREAVPATWLFGGDFYVNACATLDDLRAELSREGGLSLPPRYTFLTLSHESLDEHLDFYQNGIRDGDVLLVCSKTEWLLKVTFPRAEESFVEIRVNPSCTVGEFKRIVGQSQFGSNVSSIEDAYVVCVGGDMAGIVLLDGKSLESQISEGQNLLFNP